MKNGIKLAALVAAFVLLVLLYVPLLRGAEPAIEQSLTSEQPLHTHPAMAAMHKEAIRQRELAGIKSHYELDEQCCQWAQKWANEMARMGSMVHSSNAYAKGEIIACGYSLPGSLAAWRASGGHWFWMGGNSEYAGWGYQLSANGTPFYCGCFRSRPRPAATAVQAVVNVTQQFTSNRRRLFGRR